MGRKLRRRDVTRSAGAVSPASLRLGQVAQEGARDHFDLQLRNILRAFMELVMIGMGFHFQLNRNGKEAITR